MTRAQKIRKLGNAIVGFLGVSKGGRWIFPPKPNEKPMVEKWLRELGALRMSIRSTV